MDISINNKTITAKGKTMEGLALAKAFQKWLVEHKAIFHALHKKSEIEFTVDVISIELL